MPVPNAKVYSHIDSCGNLIFNILVGGFEIKLYAINTTNSKFDPSLPFDQYQKFHVVLSNPRMLGSQICNSTQIIALDLIYPDWKCSFINHMCNPTKPTIVDHSQIDNLYAFLLSKTAAVTAQVSAAVASAFPGWTIIEPTVTREAPKAVVVVAGRQERACYHCKRKCDIGDKECWWCLSLDPTKSRA